MKSFLIYLGKRPLFKTYHASTAREALREAALAQGMDVASLITLAPNEIAWHGQKLRAVEITE